MGIKRIFRAALLVSFLFLLCVSSFSATLLLGTRGGSPATIILPAKYKGQRLALAVLKDFADKRGLPVTVDSASGGASIPASGTIFSLEDVTTCPVAQGAGLSISSLSPASKDEAYIITAKQWGARQLVSIIGKSDKGVDAGAWYLLSKMSWWADTLTVSEFSEYRNPEFKGRELVMSPSVRNIGVPTLWMKTEYTHESWATPRLGAYVRFAKASGFNSIELVEITNAGGGASSLRSVLAPILYTLADTAHSLNMQTTQFIWGSYVRNEASGGATPLWPASGRKQFYDSLAMTYGTRMDRILTHWGDPGDAAEMNCVTPQEATTYLLNAYKAYNPNVTAIISLWGYSQKADAFFHTAGCSQLAQQTYSPQEVMIGLDASTWPSWYQTNAPKIVKAAGRGLGIWLWYTADFEMKFGSYLHSRCVDKAFTELRRLGGDSLDMATIEHCWHGLPSDINSYVAGQEFWNPVRPSSEIIYDYCRAVYGAPNADIMAQVYKTIERGEVPLPNLQDYTAASYEYRNMIPMSRVSWPEIYTTDTAKNDAFQALLKINRVVLPTGWITGFTHIKNPLNDVHCLKWQLANLSQGNKTDFGTNFPNFTNGQQPDSSLPVSASNLRVSQGVNSVTLQWHKGTDPQSGVIHFIVKDTVLLGSTTDTLYVDASAGALASDAYKVYTANTYGMMNPDASLMSGPSVDENLPKGRERAFTLYPNPFSGNMRIILPGFNGLAGAGKLEVFDVAGKVVRSWDIGKAMVRLSWDGKDAYRRSALGTGVYLFKYQTEGKVFYRKTLLLR